MNYRIVSCCLLMQNRQQNRLWRVLCAWLLAIVLVAGVLWPQAAAAHGGVVIDSGFTDHFEWLVSIDPYPIETGQATLTLLVFDLATYDPVSDLAVTVLLAAPGTTRPCCNPADLSAPIPLVIDPQLYPGDYSEKINLDQPGEWALQFVVEGGERSFTVVVPVPVKAAPAGPIDSALATPDVAATATVYAQNVAQARQQNSPLPGPVIPLTTTGSSDMAAAIINTPGPMLILGFRWWLWGFAALIPLIMGWLLLRSPQRHDDEE